MELAPKREWMSSGLFTKEMSVQNKMVARLMIHEVSNERCVIKNRQKNGKWKEIAFYVKRPELDPWPGNFWM